MCSDEEKAFYLNRMWSEGLTPFATQRMWGATARRVEELEFQNAVLREMPGDPKAGDPERLSNRRKAELGERLRRDYGFRLKEVLAFMRISKSSYEYERRALGRRAARRGRRPARWSSYAGETDGRPANVPLERARARREAGEDFRLAHDFSAEGPGELLVTDVTEFRLPAGKAYASPVLDCWDGCPVGLSVSSSPDQELCSSSLAAALSIEPGARPVVHTDGGSCYRSARWKTQREAAGAVRLMSRRGTCPDNARAEGFFGTLKQEFFYGRTWVGVSVGSSPPSSSATSTGT